MSPDTLECVHMSGKPNNFKLWTHDPSGRTTCSTHCKQSPTGAGMIASQYHQTVSRQGWPAVPTVARRLLNT